ncbi:MAG: hypothetical protein IPG93_22090 [Burkholderiales bacterium]|nr:hypothetical protein [Burkholderiales bacterium]
MTPSNRFTKLLVVGLTMLAATAQAQTSVGVSIDIRQPGVYGRIDIGNAPPPPVVYAQPVLITEPERHMRQRPIYLYVPPGHQKNWARHCARYGACGQPVYFVREQWAAEQRKDRPGHRRDKGHKGRGHDD